MIYYGTVWCGLPCYLHHDMFSWMVDYYLNPSVYTIQSNINTFLFVTTNIYVFLNNGFLRMSFYCYKLVLILLHFILFNL
jgi:hypothetical protein